MGGQHRPADMSGRQGASKFGTNLRFGNRSKPLSRWSSQPAARGRYSSGIFIRGASFTEKLLQLFVGVPRGLVVCLAPVLSLTLFTKCRGEGILQCSPANDSCKLATCIISCDPRISLLCASR